MSSISTGPPRAAPAGVPAPGSPAVRTVAAEGVRRRIAWWLLACAALVFAMVVLGGVTRLTGSGLSMVRWEPVSGVVPPLDAAAWEREFAHYRESPQYRKVNAGMSLAAFKRIYWYEYAHRLLGRLIGLVFLLPLAYFVVTGAVRGRLAIQLAIVFLLGAGQGALGWYMVMSGLVDVPQVSQYRLAAHLGAAVVIYAYLLWTALGLLSAGATAPPRSSGRTVGWGLALAGVAFLTVLSGGLVAGLKAGLAYNTFPLMNGQWVPAGLYATSPWYLDLFENVTTVQFNHRVLATLTLASVLGAWLRLRRRPLAPPARVWLHLTALAVLLQAGLGIATLLLHVPVALAATHQAGALVLLTTLIGLARAR